MIGFLNVYKPQGMTSFDAVRKIKRQVKPEKVGHLGTLDPMAEGILPIAIGHGTRLIEYITDTTKTYRTTMVCGGISDTQDCWGTITPLEETAPASRETIEQVLSQFRGYIEQIPPMYSAVHHEGKRLYELARQGITVERPARTVCISRLELLGISQDEAGKQEISLRVECSEGTYIRTLCHDIGQKLGSGAYMKQLVRERWGAFSLQNAIPLEEAAENWQQHLLDPLQVLHDLPSYLLQSEENQQAIWFGNAIPCPEDFPEGKQVLLIKPDGTLAAIAGKQQGKTGGWEVQPYKVFK